MAGTTHIIHRTVPLGHEPTAAEVNSIVQQIVDAYMGVENFTRYGARTVVETDMAETTHMSAMPNQKTYVQGMSYIKIEIHI